MSMYAIQDSTLTALGDAVRSKVIGTTTGKETYHFELSYKQSSIEVIPLAIATKYKWILNVNYYKVFQFFVRSKTNGDYYLNSALMDSGELSIEGEANEPYLRIGFVNVDMYSDAYCSIDLTIIPLDENGNEYKYTPLEMADAITGLMTIPDEAFNITDNCQYKYAFNGSNWLIDNYGDKIITNNISNASYMFYFSDVLKEIPFEINMKKDGSIEDMFNNCQYLLHSPKVNYPELTKHIKFGSVFTACHRLREVPEWLVDLLERDYNLPVKNTTFGPWISLFEYCRGIRKIPERVMKSIRNDNMTGNYYGVCYSKPFGGMSCLDELVGVHCDNYNYTSNQFNGFFKELNRVKNITFATNEDGTPVVRPWKSQTIDLTNYIGSCSNNTYDKILNYTTITLDKRVIDDTTYQALKNDPDYWTTDVNYSRYNHDSAVNTINSLPDCSATGTNTIKFKGDSGALTDGGAINTLTEEEIAVATAKGWVVSYV